MLLRHRLAVFAAAAVALVGATAAALAHASLLRATPSDGAVLAAWPTQMALTFSEPVRPLVLTLVGPGGSIQRVETIAPSDVLTIDLPEAASAEGSHVLSWRVVSSDGHPVGGAVRFAVGAPSANPPVVELSSCSMTRH